MADRSSEKPKRHRSHAITRLYGCSRFPDSIDASLLYATEVSMLIPPDVENMRGVNDPSLSFAHRLVASSSLVSDRLR